MARNFPFDTQSLPIDLAMSSEKERDLKKGRNGCERTSGGPSRAADSTWRHWHSAWTSGPWRQIWPIEPLQLWKSSLYPFDTYF